MVIHRPGADPVALDYREQAPVASNIDLYRDENGEFVPERIRRGALAVGIPGTVRGLCYAHEKYGSGKMTLAEILEPARKLACHHLLLKSPPSYIASMYASLR